MDQPANTKPAPKNPDMWSKMTDGIMTSATLILIWLVVVIAIRPIQLFFGPPGLLVYVLGLLAVAMFALQQALVTGRAETLRAWYGITAGFLCWSVVQVCGYLGVPILPNLAGVVLLIMAVLIAALLWRTLPLGARFFGLTLLLNWSEYVFMRFQVVLASFSPIFKLTYRATGFVAIALGILVIVWILFKSRRRIHRVNAALMIWFLVSLAVYVFNGSLF